MSTSRPPHETPDASWSQQMREVAAERAPSPEAVARVAERLDVLLAPATDLLQGGPTAPAGAVDRVAARLASPRPTPSYGPRIAALALLGAAAVGGVVWVSTALSSGSPVAVLDASGRLLSDGQVASHDDGEGTLAMEGDRLVADWVVGELALDPVAGLAVQVTTREVVVRGTEVGLLVHRDALGTRVEATDGDVTMTCGAAEPRAVVAGEASFCLPQTPSGLLGRARALGERGDTAAALEAVRAGLAAAPDDVVAAELLHVRATQELAAGRLPAAVEAAEEALLRGASPRADELRRLAARGWLVAGDCARALPHLEELAAPDAGERQHLDRCRAVVEE